MHKAFAVFTMMAASAFLAQGSSITLAFPDATSTLGGPGCGSDQPLGVGGGGACFVAGDRIQETFTLTGLASTVSSHWVFSMSTFVDPSVVNTFNVLINNIVVGNYQFTGAGPDTRNFDLTFASAPIAGDTYTLELLATSTVPPGLSSYNWFPGGQVTLTGTSAVPEPSSILLISLGLIACGFLHTRRIRSSTKHTV